MKTKTPRYGTKKKEKYKKTPGALTPLLFSLPTGPKIYYGPVRYKPKWCKRLKLVTYQDMTCLFFGQPPCFRVRDEEHDEIF